MIMNSKSVVFDTKRIMNTPPENISPWAFRVVTPPSSLIMDDVCRFLVWQKEKDERVLKQRAMMVKQWGK